MRSSSAPAPAGAVLNLGADDEMSMPGEGIHEMGTARMGRDPETSVLNAFNQVHDAPNVFGEAGVLVSEVLYVKEGEGVRFAIIDAGMNDLMRPSLYGSYHEIRPLRERDGEGEAADVVGPICESGDFLAKDRMLPAVEQGEVLAVGSAGAYGFTMSSNYNSRPRAAEVMVDGTTAHLIKARETLDDLLLDAQWAGLIEAATNRYIETMPGNQNP